VSVLSQFLSSSRRSVAFTQSGTWTVPEGVRFVSFLLIGGGGAGGGGGANSGRGGGGGQVGYWTDIPVVPGLQISITVGAGGTCPNSTSNGNPGGSTSIGISGRSWYSVNGGGGGQVGITGSAGTGGGSTGVSVGLAGTNGGDPNTYYPAGSNNPQYPSTSTGGGACLGPGGNAGTGTYVNGSPPAYGFGGGGGGGGAYAIGGAGANGVAIIFF
jgi:hypothetical protein